MQNCHLFLEAKSQKQFRFPFQLQKTTKKLSIHIVRTLFENGKKSKLYSRKSRKMIVLHNLFFHTLRFNLIN
jgi:hypothetical protein